MVDGKLFLTTSSGEQWKEGSLPVNYPSGVIQILYFLKDGITGWAGGGRYQLESKTVPRPRYAIDGRSDGIYVSTPALYLTSDGGLTWTPQFISSDLGYSVNQIMFLDNEAGTAAIQSSIGITHNGGRLWEAALKDKNTIPPRNASDIFMLDRDNIWVSFGDGSLINSEDGGVRWKNLLSAPSQEMAIVPESLIHLWFWSKKDGLAQTRNQDRIELTKDGGRTWAVLFSERNVQAFSAPDANHIWVIGDGTLFRLVGLRMQDAKEPRAAAR